MDELNGFDGDDDAALRYAIALSLQEAGTSSTPKQPIELSSEDDGEDDDDGDLEKGPAGPPTPKRSPSARPSNQQKTGGDTKGESSQNGLGVVSSQQSAPTPQTGLAALGIDRKKMEEERLARIAVKRKAPADNADGREDSERRRRVKLDSTLQPTTASSTLTLPGSKSSRSHQAHAPSSSLSGSDASRSSSTRTKPKNLPYPKGVVKKTWARGYPRQGDDIKIEEVLQKDSLELAVISSFQWDDEWMMSKIDIGPTQLVCIAFAANEEQKRAMEANVPEKFIRFCFPPMMPAGSMHSKLQLLKYPTYLRIVVPSGNMVPYDWGETGAMENMVFMIDLPLIDDPTSWTTNELTSFGDDLRYFLQAQGLSESLLNSLSKYDFSETKRYRFVHTIGKSHVGDDWKRTGYPGLGRAVSSLGLQTNADVDIDLIVASLGSLNADLISAIYNAAQGDDGLKEYSKRTGKGTKPTAKKDTAPWKNSFRIYFPSRDTVIQSRGSKNAGGTICVRRQWWESPSFPRDLIRDCQSVRPGLLMHSKAMFVRHPQAGKSGSAWSYMGSANLSESAWGRLVKDKSTGRPKLNCRNWECGVLIQVPVSEEAAAMDHRTDLSIFQGTIPVPMIPGEAYGASSSKTPWFFLEN